MLKRLLLAYSLALFCLWWSPIAGGASPKNGEAASTLNSIGAVYQALGQPQKALEYYERALPLWRQAGAKRGEAFTLNNLGRVYYKVGQPQKALECCERALPLQRQVRDRDGESRSLGYIGRIYYDTGQPQKALKYWVQQLRLEREMGDKDGEALVLNCLAATSAAAGQWQESLEYCEQALPLSREMGNKDEEGAILDNLGIIYNSTGQPQRALANYEQALALCREVMDKSGEAITLEDIGQVYQDTGQPQKALQCYEKALPLMQAVGDKDEQANTLANSAYTRERIGDPQGARKEYEQALILVEAVVGSITRDEIKRSAAESYQWIYRKYIDFLLRQGNAADNGRAMEVSEMARSRALRDLLAGNTSQLLSAMRQEQVQPAMAIAASTATVPGPGTHSTLRGVTASAVLRSAHAVGLAVEDLPPLLSTAKAVPFRREEAVRAAIAGPVVSYHLLEKDLAIFVVEPSGALHVARAGMKPADLLKLIEEARIAITANDDPSETRASLSKLYDVLIQPVEKWLPPTHPTPAHPYTTTTSSQPSGLGSRLRSGLRLGTSPQLHTPTHSYTSTHSYAPTPTLTIVPFGPLFQVPFAALIGPGGQYLVEHFTLRTTPSLTVLRFTRQQSAAMQKAPMRPALYGDPMMPEGWPDLKGAMQEVRQVAQALGTPTPTHTRERATEAAFRMEAPTATEIHLATHGFINPTQPLLSGIVLGKSEGKEPAYQRDGYLTAAEVFRLKLHARLVTLSACETGLGATSADGVFGLQSAFLSAGSASLLSTLWKVNDEATSRLMTEFYQRLEADPDHNRASALQEAQLSLRQSPEFKNPLYWAGFVLTGEAR